MKKKKNNLKINHLNDNYKILSFSIHLASKHLVAISKKQTNNNKKSVTYMMPEKFTKI